MSERHPDGPISRAIGEALKRNPARRERDLYDLSKAELQARIGQLKEQLEIYRLPSPERMTLIERLLEVQDRLLGVLVEK